MHFQLPPGSLPGTGVRRVCDSPLFNALHSAELELIVCGEQALDFAQLRKNAHYDGYQEDSDYIVSFWKLLMNFDLVQKKRFLSFVTGSDLAPVGGLQELQLVIQRNGDEPTERLPTAHTYGTSAKLERMVVTAMHNAEGFGSVAVHQVAPLSELHELIATDLGQMAPGQCMVEPSPDSHWGNISFGALAEDAEITAAMLTREAEDLSLSTGAHVQQLHLKGDRLKYKLLTGEGPAEGWVSVQLSGKPLAVVNEQANGEFWGLDMPLTPAELKRMGPEWLTKALHKSKALPLDNSVGRPIAARIEVSITEFSVKADATTESTAAEDLWRHVATAVAESVCGFNGRTIAESTHPDMSQDAHVLDLSDAHWGEFLSEEWYRPEAIDIANMSNDNISIFVDNFNIASGISDDGRDTRQLRVASFSEAVAGRRRVSLRVIAKASGTRVLHPQWQSWNARGFRVEWELCLPCCVLGHVENLERRGADRAREVLALCTGDGRLAPTVESVSRRGWRVEIWCWRATCASAYHTLASDTVKICFLDDYRLQITRFRLGGDRRAEAVQPPCLLSKLRGFVDAGHAAERSDDVPRVPE
eukprot:Skav233913  [mRNA]  locus=scaffold435:499367:513640:+ [translate_table: standard]